MPMRTSIGIALSAVVLAGYAVTVQSDARDLPTCAQQDLQMVNLIELHGENQSVAAHKLAAATRTMIRARKACYRGRFEEALALYGGIRAELMATHSQ